ncbi:hypothetical protein ACTNE5_07705, partial [Acidaminococcus fermentans]|uniref:hypothetical protein n=1 Tax=Acidaminococcus fermentans TaxID=905 RepID=UPI003F89D98C
ERGKYTLFLLLFTARSKKRQQKRSCEEMNPHFFTAPCFLSAGNCRWKSNLQIDFEQHEL